MSSEISLYISHHTSNQDYCRRIIFHFIIDMLPIVSQWLKSDHCDIYNKMVYIINNIIECVPDILSEDIQESLIYMVETGNPENALTVIMNELWSRNDPRFCMYFQFIQDRYKLLTDPPFSFLDSTMWYYVDDLPSKDLLCYNVD